MERKFLEVKASGVNAGCMTVEGMASFKEVDRMGDLMLPTAFDDKLKTYMSNPVLAWCHNIMTIPPIGKVTEFEVRENGPHFKAKFDTDAFSKLIFSKYKSGSMRAFSVQFQPDEVRRRISKSLMGVVSKSIPLSGLLIAIVGIGQCSKKTMNRE